MFVDTALFSELRELTKLVREFDRSTTFSRPLLLGNETLVRCESVFLKLDERRGMTLRR